MICSWGQNTPQPADCSGDQMSELLLHKHITDFASSGLESYGYLQYPWKLKASL